jgi:hypothetical protein
LGGDFQAAGGPSGEVAVGLVGPAGGGIDFGLRGDIHGTDGPRVYVLSLRAEPRYVLPIGDQVAPFVGARATVGAWGFRVANPLTLGWTDVSAGGWGIGATLGLLAASPGQRIHMVIAATWDWMWFGDAGSEAFTFSNTSAKAQQFGFELGLRVRLPKRGQTGGRR